MLKLKNQKGTSAAMTMADAGGGRNLLRNTGEMPIGAILENKYSAYVNSADFQDTGNGVKLTYRTGATEGITIPIVFEDCVKHGDIVTLSFEYRGNITSFGQFYWMQKTGSNFFSTISEPMVADDTNWQKYKTTFTAQYVNTRINTYIMLLYQMLDSDKWIEIKKGTLKLEHGSIATDWTPAPEDFQSQLDELKAQITALGG